MGDAPKRPHTPFLTPNQIRQILILKVLKAKLKKSLESS